MQAGEGQLDIRLDPHRPDDGGIRRRSDQVFQQRRLSDPGLAPQHQRPALTAPDRRDQLIQQRALLRPTSQAWAAARSAETALRRHWRSRRSTRARAMRATSPVPALRSPSKPPRRASRQRAPKAPPGDALYEELVRAAVVIVAMVRLLSVALAGVLAQLRLTQDETLPHTETLRPFRLTRQSRLGAARARRAVPRWSDSLHRRIERTSAAGPHRWPGSCTVRLVATPAQSCRLHRHLSGWRSPVASSRWTSTTPCMGAVLCTSPTARSPTCARRTPRRRRSSRRSSRWRPPARCTRG